MAVSAFLRSIGLGRPELRAWAMYDWANSAYATIVMAAVLPPFFATYYAAGLSASRATALYGMLISVSILGTALLSPVLGAMADLRGSRKLFLARCTGIGAAALLALCLMGEGQWLGASVCVGIAAVGFGASLVFYDGLLPGIATADEVDRVSAAGYALGYLGGGLLLAVCSAWILWPGMFGMADAAVAVRWSLFATAVWWVLFSLPLFIRVPEAAATAAPGTGGQSLGAAVARLLSTLREIRRYRQLFTFLLAFWFYNDGIGTIIKMATIFGSEIGIGLPHLVLALLLTQFIAFPFSLLFGRLAATIGPRRGIYIALAVYTLIAVLGFLMTKAWHFYVLAGLVGTVQGGAQALSRSLFVRMVPPARAGEFFGFFSVSSKFATVLGPALFAAVTFATGSSRWAVLCMVAFFVPGMFLLSRVDISEGERQAGTSLLPAAQ